MGARRARQRGRTFGNDWWARGTRVSELPRTFPIFGVAVLIATSLNRHTTMTMLGAQLYFLARVAFVPVYALGIPVVRTLVWAVALVGIVLVLQVGWLGM